MVGFGKWIRKKIDSKYNKIESIGYNNHIIPTIRLPAKGENLEGKTYEYEGMEFTILSLQDDSGKLFYESRLKSIEIKAFHDLGINMFVYDEIFKKRFIGEISSKRIEQIRFRFLYQEPVYIPNFEGERRCEVTRVSKKILEAYNLGFKRKIDRALNQVDKDYPTSPKKILNTISDLETIFSE